MIHLRQEEVYAEVVMRAVFSHTNGDRTVWWRVLGGIHC